jgi:hypothetical protein
MISTDTPELRRESFEEAAAAAASAPTAAAVKWELRSRDVSTLGAQYEAFLYTATLMLAH